MKNKILTFITVGLLAGPMAVNATPVFTNASFETGNDSGWTVVNPFGGVWDWSVLTGGALAAMDGTYAVWFGATDNGGSLYGQTLNGFTIGNQYKVSFGMVPEQGSNTGRPGAFATLDLIGADVSSALFATDCADPNDFSFFSCAPGWQDQSLTFTAQNTTISFTWGADLSQPSWEFGFDNIRLEAVPVPAAVWLFGSGLLGLIGVARRKARA